MPARSPNRASSRTPPSASTNTTSTEPRENQLEECETGQRKPPHPFLLALPDGVDVALDPLRLRLDFHEESVLLQEFGRNVIRTRLVSALDVAHTLASELDLSTGLLPPDTLWWGRSAGGESLAIYREARVWTVCVCQPGMAHFDGPGRPTLVV